MPTQARWLIKTALMYLTAALALGVVRAAQTAGMVPGTASELWLPQLHFLTVGWLTQLIFGVAFWLFPNPDANGAAYSHVVWAAYGALNVGLLLRMGCEPALLTEDLQTWGLVTSAALQWGASLLLVGHFWRRVRPK
jgi:hypothetical protein